MSLQVAPEIPASTRVTPNRVGDIAENLRDSLQVMHQEMSTITDASREKRKIGVATSFNVGDFVLVARPLQAGNKK